MGGALLSTRPYYVAIRPQASLAVLREDVAILDLLVCREAFSFSFGTYADFRGMTHGSYSDLNHSATGCFQCSCS